jgi:tetratricopeptide (TPR) repeat protein
MLSNFARKRSTLRALTQEIKRTKAMQTCDAARANMSHYLEGCLSAEQASDLETHCESCRECAKEFERLVDEPLVEMCATLASDCLTVAQARTQKRKASSVPPWEAIGHEPEHVPPEISGSQLPARTYFGRLATEDQIPLQPIDPLTIAEAARMQSCFVVYHDSQGRVVSLHKVVWSPKKGEEPQQLATVFSETYDYWPGGTLRARVRTAPGENLTEEYFDRNGNVVPSTSIPLRCLEIHSLGAQAQDKGDYRTALEKFKEALTVAKEEESLMGEAAALTGLAWNDRDEAYRVATRALVEWKRGNHALAEPLYREAERLNSSAVNLSNQALPMYQAIGSAFGGQLGVINAWLVFGDAEMKSGVNLLGRHSSSNKKPNPEEIRAIGHLKTASHCFGNAASMAQRCEILQLEAVAREQLGHIACWEKNWPAAIESLKKAVDLREALRQPEEGIPLLDMLCSAHILQKNTDAAVKINEELLALVRLVHDRFGEARAWLNFAKISALRGRHTAAFRFLALSYVVVEEVEDTPGNSEQMWYGNIREDALKAIRSWQQDDEHLAKAMVDQTRAIYHQGRDLNLIDHAFFEPATPDESRADQEVTAALKVKAALPEQRDLSEIARAAMSSGRLCSCIGSG